MEKKLDKQEQARIDESVVIIMGIKAIGHLSEATAIAQRDGKTNGEMKTAMDYYKESRDSLKAIQAGEIPPITKSRILRLRAMTMGLRPRRESTPRRVIIDIDPTCPYVLVRCIINENSLDTLQDTPAESHQHDN